MLQSILILGDKVIEYNLGCNFSYELLDCIIKLNKRFTDKNICIKEMFGSTRRYSSLTARPLFRLPNVSNKFVESYVQKCNDNNIEFNYTTNSLNPGSKRDLLGKRRNIYDFFKYLKNIGIKRVTISNVLLMELVSEAVPDFPIEVSTVMHVDTLSQIKWLKSHFNIDKVCGAIIHNRDIRFLKGAALLCDKLGIKYEVLVNEFCGNGGLGNNQLEAYGTNCILRDHCYVLHSSNITKKDAELFNVYPMGYCMDSRTDPATWIKMRFILPQDIYRYYDIGINNFKISGRTGSTDYLLQMAFIYLQQLFQGNLLSLWKPLETIYTEENETEFKHPYYISCLKLSKMSFMDHWFNNEAQRCSEEDCGVTCQYCNLIYQKIKED